MMTTDIRVTPEIDIDQATHAAIQQLRNESFPKHQVARSYYKQCPHLRLLAYDGDTLTGHLGLDYRRIRVGDSVLKVLGVIDFCVREQVRGTGIGSAMLTYLNQYAQSRAVDFIMLLSEHETFYRKHGFQNISAQHHWLMIHEHQNFGIGHHWLDDLWVCSIQGAPWPDGEIDWLGYLY
ncbi:GNAT family N-acetyltransferase [Photobacterium sp. GJ3]|uniref:GNAT family N-acetyltransferase n=1 Tax=Photobacterium sp. GJ3 TaxID=2829502 RepID=UPI00353025A9